MGVLHVLCRSSSNREVWNRCLERMTGGDALLMVADAVYAVDRWMLLEPFAAKDIELYVLLPDMLARGVGKEGPPASVELIDFEGFVDLTLDYQRVLTW